MTGRVNVAPKINVVVLNYNGWKDTVECLESVLQSGYDDFDVIVVDNGSTDGSVERIIDWAKGAAPFTVPQDSPLKNSASGILKPVDLRVISSAESVFAEIAGAKVTVITAGFNRGFSGGNNVGIKYAMRREHDGLIWLLNNDTVVPADTMMKLAGFVSAGREKGLKPGITGTIQLYYNRPDIIQAASGGFNKWKGAFLNNGEGEKYAGYKPGKFEYVYGASMMLTTEFIREAGLLSMDYFLYYEEIDLAVRARRVGYTSAVAADAVVYHKYGGSILSNGGGLRAYYLEKNRIVFYKKHYPSLMFFMFLYQVKNILFSGDKKAYLRGMIDGFFGAAESNRILIMEFNDHHEEVIGPLEELLREGFETHLYVNEKLMERNILTCSGLTPVKQKKMHKLFAVFSMLFRVMKENISMVIYNTYGDRYAAILSALLPKRVMQVGIAHNLDGIKKNQNVKNFIVLSKELHGKAKLMYPEYNFSYFYPLVKSAGPAKEAVPETVAICVPGKIENKRRAYADLITFVEANQPLNGVKFTLLGNMLGNDGPEILKCIKDRKLEKYFEVFEGFISYEKYFSVLSGCAMIMPLIHPGMEGYVKYNNTKITAAFNMAYSFAKPLLMHEDFSESAEFKDFGLFYRADNFGKLLNDKIVLLAKINTVSENIKAAEKFNSGTQSLRLALFLNGISAETKTRLISGKVS